MIAAIEPVRFTIEQNTVFKLPQTVVAQYSDGTARNAAVLWDLKTVNSTVEGTQIIEGTIEGYGEKVQLILEVKVPTETDAPTIETLQITVNGESRKVTSDTNGFEFKVEEGSGISDLIITMSENIKLASGDSVLIDEMPFGTVAVSYDDSSKLIITPHDLNFKADILGEFTIKFAEDVLIIDESENNFDVSTFTVKLTVTPQVEQEITQGYSGIIKDENGPINLGKLFIEDSNGVTVGNIVVDADGKFTFDLPDGNYFIKLIRENIPLNINFSIQNGLLYQNETVTGQFVVTLPPVTVQGRIVDESGVAIGSGKIGIINVNDHEIYNHYWDIDENGAFSLRLADGEYKVTAINQDNTDYRFIPMQVAFSVQEGNLFVNGEAQETLNLTLPLPNFNGQLLQLGQPLASTFIYFFLKGTKAFP